jgi:hypothetical protein
MKSFTLLSLLAIAFAFTSCDAIKGATNTTGGAVFSLNGKWQLETNTPENTLTGTVVTVTPFISEGRITTLSNNTQCYREKDIKWKSIKADNTGGYRIDNLLSNCSATSLVYQVANITVVNNSEIRVSGPNATGQENVQTWRRVN